VLINSSFSENDDLEDLSMGQILSDEEVSVSDIGTLDKSPKKKKLQLKRSMLLPFIDG